MGQQQLLLVILVTIIVGIATVVAINIFGTAAEQANVDAVRQDLLGAAAQAQAIWARPAMMGGAGQNFGTMDQAALLRQLRIPGSLGTEVETAGEVSNENGTYTIEASDTRSITIQGVPSQADVTLNVVVSIDANNNWDIVMNETEGGGDGGNGGAAD